MTIEELESLYFRIEDEINKLPDGLIKQSLNSTQVAIRNEYGKLIGLSPVSVLFKLKEIKKKP